MPPLMEVRQLVSMAVGIARVRKRVFIPYGFYAPNRGMA